MAALCCSLWVALPPVHICPLQLQKLHASMSSGKLQKDTSVGCIHHKRVAAALPAREAASPTPATLDTCQAHMRQPADV